jgi:hypothetical protein
MPTIPIKVLPLPGIRRDGTLLEAKEWHIGQHVRFQRGRPRKMRGIKSVTTSLTDESRQLFTQTKTGTSYIHSGHKNGIDEVSLLQTGAVFSTVNRTPGGFVINANNTWQFAAIFDPVSALQQFIAVCTTSLLDPTDGGTNGIYSGPMYTSAALTALPLLPFSSTKASITAITQAASAIVTVNTVSGSNPFAVSQVVAFTGVLGMTQINNLTGTISAIGGSSGAWTITVGINSTSFTAYTSAGTVGVTITGVSGGLCVLNPYTILYGSDGYWAWSDPNSPFNFITVAAGNANITAQKILRGIPLRGGSGFAPAGLFWSVDALIRATFIGGSSVWQWDTLTTETSLLSANCVVEVDGSFYWAGADGRFYVYNGVVRELENNLNLNWFYDNINSTNAAKAFCFRHPRWSEIWWCYPHGAGQSEPNRAIIYNYKDKTWYDTGLLGLGRSAGILGDGPLGILMSDGDGAGASAYNLWMHDVGTDLVGQNTTTPIDAFIETGPISRLEEQRPDSGALSTEFLEPDFIQSGDMTVTVYGRGTAKGTDIQGATYNIRATPADTTQTVVPIKETFRQMRLRFESNTPGGDFQMGDNYLHIHLDGKRLTQ